jgi:macrolide transport system ATP-binding/permease protein
MIASIWRRIHYLLHRDRYASELEEEMRLHVEMRAGKNIASGMEAREAQYAARRRFGNSGNLEQTSRDSWGLVWLDRLQHDLGFAARHLSRHRFATLVAVLTLGLGIGANVALFSFVSALLFRPLAVPNNERLAWVTIRDRRTQEPRLISLAEYGAYSAQRAVVSSALAFGGERLSFGQRPAQYISGSVVSANYFDMLGLTPALGRAFVRDDDDPATGRAAVIIGYDLWQNRFGGSRGVLDTSLTVNGRAFTVVGIAPRGFSGVIFGAGTQLWIPLGMSRVVAGEEKGRVDPNRRWLNMIVRRAPNATLAEANSGLAVVHRRLDRLVPLDSGTQLSVAPVVGGLDPAERARAMPLLTMLMVVPALVLLVACGNVGNLRLARALARRKEFALRRALGATRSRLISQLLVESLLLSLLAGAVGVLLSYWLTALLAYLTQFPPVLAKMLQPDWRVLLASGALALLSGLVFGLAPAIGSTKPALVAALKEDGLAIGGGIRHHRVRDAFVVMQVALSLVLLVTAGIFIYSTQRMLDVDPGFDARGAVALYFDLGTQGYAPAARAEFGRRLLDRLQATPGVQSAALTSALPLFGSAKAVQAFTRQDGATSVSIGVQQTAISNDYFKAMGIPVVRGRSFSRANDGADRTAIVSVTLAGLLWPGESPIGKVVQLEGASGPVLEVIGMVGDAKYRSLTEERTPMIYVPWKQQWAGPELSVVLRTTPGLGLSRQAVADVVREVDAGQPFNALPLTQIVSRTAEKQRSLAGMLRVFGAIALFVAGLGIFGVTAQAVSQRTREIGVRMSLGARSSDVVRLFVFEGLRLSSVGAIVGIAISTFVARTLRSRVYAVELLEPATIGAATALVIAVALFACYLPSRKAARVDPLRTLRQE